MKRFIPILGLALAAMTACTNDATGPNGAIQGNWTLRTLNGSSLPYYVGGNTTISSEQLTLANDGSYTLTAFYSSGTSFTEYGYYTQNNNVITFNDQTDAVQYTGSISGDVLTEFDPTSNMTAVFQRT